MVQSAHAKRPTVLFLYSVQTMHWHTWVSIHQPVGRERHDRSPMFPRTHPHSLASQSSTMLPDWTLYISSISALTRNLEVSTESPRIVHDGSQFNGSTGCSAGKTPEFSFSRTWYCAGSNLPVYPSLPSTMWSRTVAFPYPVTVYLARRKMMLEIPTRRIWLF